MGQLEDLQRNRLARIQNLNKGFNLGGSDDDLIKAHQDGDIHPNGKWVWVSSAAGGKGDWRTIKKNVQTQAQPQQKPAAKSDDQKALDDYVDASGYSNVEKNIAHAIISGSSEANIKAAGKQAGIDKDVLDIVYKKATKLVSEAKDDQARKQKAAAAPKQGDAKAVTEKKVLDFLKVSSSKYNDINMVNVEKTPQGNWELYYDERSISIVQADQFTESELKSAGLLNRLPDGIDLPGRSAKQPQPKQQRPDFSPKYPATIAKLNRQSDYTKWTAAYRELGEDLFNEKYATVDDFKKEYLADLSWGNAPASQGEWDDVIIQKKEQMARRLVGAYGRHGATNTEQIAEMKKYYDRKAAAAEEEYVKQKNDEYWAGPGAARKAAIMAEGRQLSEKLDKQEEDFSDEVRGLVSYSGNYDLRVELPTYRGSDARVVFSQGRSAWGDVTVDFKNNMRYSYGTTAPSNQDPTFTPELSMSSQRVDFGDKNDFEKAQFVINTAADMMKPGVSDKLSKRIAELAKERVAIQKRWDEINKELKADHSND